MQYVADQQVGRAVRIWLIIGLVMVFFQIFIGGVTRLTGSGLSITKWEVVSGTFPPMSAAAWEVEFDHYKATPQYQKINAGMSMSEFKFIYFWEYFHRLWARLMFFVFVFPFGWFLWRGMLSRKLTRRLVVVVLLAGLEGFFGWIMVKSGLRSRPWVSAYNLTLHLTMGFLIFAYLLWTFFVAYKPDLRVAASDKARRWGWGIAVLAFVQVALGAMMSGSKAGLSYPTWPMMNGVWMPDVLLDGAQWQLEHFIQYDKGAFMVTFIQFCHRNTAYLLTALIIYWWWQTRPLQVGSFRRANWIMLGALALQVVLGIVTLVNCVAKIPVDLGVAHQAGAVLLTGAILWVLYHMRKPDAKLPQPL
jgi:heme a synthase